MKKLLVLMAIPALLFAEQKKRDESPRHMVEVTLRVILANSDAGTANDAADLVPAELKTLLRFTRYHLKDSGYVRGITGQEMRVSLAADLSGRIRVKVRDQQPGPLLEFEVEVDGPLPPGAQRAPRLLETTTTAKSGETVVLGASRMRDSSNALIVLLTGKLLP
jgi:hypothetical protein